LFSKIDEAKSENDSSSLLTLYNELMGFYRSSTRHKDSIVIGDQLLSLMKEMGLVGTEPYATSILNVATVYSEAGKIDKAMSYYNEVMVVYENILSENDMKIAGLYNNMSQAYIVKKNYDKAFNFLEKALSIVAINNGTEIEEAVTYSNMAITLMKMNKLDNALKHIEKSLSIFEKREGPKDFHYSAALSAMGEYQLLSKNNEIAIEYFNKALDEIIINTGRNIHYAVICSKISMIYDKLGNKELKEKYQSMADTIYSKA
jgi:tetratricopeptide (TPR) repeat protein